MNAVIIIIALVLFAIGSLAILLLAGFAIAIAMNEAAQLFEEPKGEKKENATRIDRRGKKNNRRRTDRSK